MKNKFGFSMIEVLIVVVILGILSLVAVPIYRGQVDRSYTLEGHALLEEVAASQEIYRDRFGKWWTTTESTTMEAALGVNTSRNKYFRGAQARNVVIFSNVTQPPATGTPTGLGFTVTIKGAEGSKAEQITMVLNWYYDKAAEITATKNGNVVKGY